MSQQYINPPRGGWKGGAPKRKAKGRNLPGHRKGVMNSTEKKYAANVLEVKKLSGEIIHYEFELMTFKLGKAVHWTPDFMVLYADGTVEFVDVKGSQPQDEAAQRVKIKLAAEKFWLFRFVVERAKRVKDGGGFEREEF